MPGPQFLVQFGPTVMPSLGLAMKYCSPSGVMVPVSSIVRTRRRSVKRADATRVLLIIYSYPISNMRCCIGFKFGSIRFCDGSFDGMRQSIISKYLPGSLAESALDDIGTNAFARSVLTRFGSSRL